MTDSTASLVLAVDTTQTAKASVDLDKLTASGERTEAQFNKTTQTLTGWQRNMAGVDAAMKSTADRSIELSQATQRIIDRYEPMGTKLRSLQADMTLFQREMGNSTSNAAMKTFQGLEDEIAKTSKLMSTAGVAGFDDMAKYAERGAFATAGAKRELMVLGHEALQGNFSRMPGSFMVLAERMSMTEALFNPLTLGIVSAAAATTGLAVAIAKGHEEMVAMDNALAVTSSYAGSTRGAMEDLAASMARSGTLSIGTSKDIVTALVASGRIGAEAMGSVAALAGNFARATGADIEKIAPELVKLFSDPLKGAEELNKTMHFLTTTDMEHIATLERLGDVQQAQLLLAQKVTEHMPKEELNVGLLAKAYRGLKTDISDMIDAAKKLGQDATPESSISATKSAIANLEKYGSSADKTGLEALKEQLALFQKGASVQSQIALGQSVAAAELDKQNLAQKEIDKSATHQVDVLRDQIKLIQSAPDSVDKAKRLLEVNEQIANLQKPKTIPGTDTRAQYLADQLTLEKTTLDREKELYDSREKMLSTYHSKLGLSDADFYDGRKVARDQYLASLTASYGKERELIADSTTKTPVESFAKQKQLDALYQAYQKTYNGIEKLSGEDAINQIADMKKVTDAADKEREKEVNKLLIFGQKEIDSFDAKIKKQTEANAQIGLTKEQIDTLKISRDLDSATADEEYAANLRIGANAAGPLHDAYLQYAIDIESVAKRKRELAGLDAQGAGKQADLTFSNAVEHDLKSAITAGFKSSGSPIAAFGNALGKAVETNLINSVANAMTKQFTGSTIGKGIMSIFGGGVAYDGGVASSAEYAAMDWLTSANGNAFGSSSVHAFADGGSFTNSIVSRPTPFAFANGGSFGLGVMGEAGDEAVMPLSRDSSGKLGVKASGNAQPAQNITVNYNMTVGDVASVSMVKQAVAGSEKRIAAGIGRSMQYGGGLS